MYPEIEVRLLMMVKGICVFQRVGFRSSGACSRRLSRCRLTVGSTAHRKSYKTAPNVATIPTARLLRSFKKDKSSQQLSLVERKTTDLRHVNLISAPRMMRSTPDDPQNDRSRPSDDQDVPDDIHLPQPRLQVVRRSLDIQKRPDETERKETERQVDEKEPLPFLSEGTSDQGSDGTGERPDATDDPGENASFR